MYNLKSKEYLKSYGQLIEDFVNAKTTDEACSRLLEGLQNTFDFPKDFAEKATKAFPLPLKIKSSLTRNEKVLVKCILAEERIMLFLRNQLHLLSLELDNYDPQKDNLIVRDIILHSWAVEGYSDVDIEYSKPFEQHINEFEASEWESMKPSTKKEIKKLMKVGKTILKLKKDVFESRFSELKKVAQQYKKAYENHTHIKRTQNELINAIDLLVTGLNLNENKYFNEFLRHYQTLYKPELVLHSDDSFSLKTKFLEADHFYKEKKEGYGFILTSYHEAISFLLVEFLMPERNRNLFYECSECNKYFVGGKSDRRIKFCSSCSPKSKMSIEKRKEYQRKYRQKKKQEKLAIQREARIEHLMKRTGYSREEAVEIIEADSKM
jgi:hypothetical protein